MTAPEHAGPRPAEEREALLRMPGFGSLWSDHMVTARWTAGDGWQPARTGPLAAFSLHPATMAFHYGQTIFEGLKAFWRPDGQRALFRPGDHARRFARSARRMAMPELPADAFLAAVAALTRIDREWVPQARGHSFYLRPFMIASETHLSNRPAEEYLFAVIGSPARPATAEPAPIRLWASPEYVRAADGGTGTIKCGGNYGGSYLAQREAAEHGCHQVVWLDARERRYVEEVGGSNLFFVEGDRLVTPPLSGTLLAGVTRDSILRLAGRLGLAVAEAPVTLEDWERGCRDGRITETFACGTARAVAPVGHAVTPDGEWAIGDGGTGPVTRRLLNALLDIHYGHAPDDFGWLHTV
ncbi:branched-chain amino acid aminotransferase [Amycolatopsis vancoresmycina]|uniref:Branched-chain-amino-acid aminotransferase n=1 Tax=Amycolatopsis vancoresmycina DSM 44592 TaxID=1292037 RepID=R1GDF7_9PSEU|nr:branched-chain amino acid aminotransferase [Amycolatopsis vancoresmycina]EOD69357.1 branched-chain amino acid aminotransferase, group II [Amycolatopsis vancoresmycina DSM 44592]